MRYPIYTADKHTFVEAATALDEELQCTFASGWSGQTTPADMLSRSLGYHSARDLCNPNDDGSSANPPVNLLLLEGVQINLRSEIRHYCTGYANDSHVLAEHIIWRAAAKLHARRNTWEAHQQLYFDELLASLAFTSLNASPKGDERYHSNLGVRATEASIVEDLTKWLLYLVRGWHKDDGVAVEALERNHHHFMRAAKVCRKPREHLLWLLDGLRPPALQDDLFALQAYRKALARIRQFRGHRALTWADALLSRFQADALQSWTHGVRPVFLEDSFTMRACSEALAAECTSIGGRLGADEAGDIIAKAIGYPNRRCIELSASEYHGDEGALILASTGVLRSTAIEISRSRPDIYAKARARMGGGIVGLLGRAAFTASIKADQADGTTQLLAESLLETSFPKGAAIFDFQSAHAGRESRHSGAAAPAEHPAEIETFHAEFERHTETLEALWQVLARRNGQSMPRSPFSRIGRLPAAANVAFAELLLREAERAFDIHC